MRARHRHLLVALLAAISLATTIPAVQTAAVADGPQYCPAGTNWNNRLQRCM